MEKINRTYLLLVMNKPLKLTNLVKYKTVKFITAGKRFRAYYATKFSNGLIYLFAWILAKVYYMRIVDIKPQINPFLLSLV